MRRPRPWTLSEINIAARAILTLERDAARARKWAGTSCQFDRGSIATEATAARWDRGRVWLEGLLKAYDAAAADPARFAGVPGFLDRGGAPNVAWAWIRENRDRPLDALTPLPEGGACRPTLSGTWRLSDVNVAGHALVAAALDSDTMGGRIRILDPARRRQRALAVVASLWGERAEWLQKIFDICEAAESEPDVFGRLVGVMDKARRPQAAWKRLSSMRDEQRVLALQPTPGQFRTLVLDPPWDEDNLSEAAGHDYAQMSIDEIRALPVRDWAADDAHLYLWLTNNTLPLACGLVALWGFEFKSFHTWVKETDKGDPKFSLGREFRNTTEHFIFARKGSRNTLPRREATYSTPTHHRWPLGTNSEKPEAFYDLVRACSYPSFGEAFQRQARSGFVNLYRPAPVPVLEAAE